jgi:hypothetical protein
MSRQYILPDLLALCPFPSGLTNPHYKAAEESSAWINSYSVFADKKRATFAQANIELLASHTYPYAGYKQFRTCCDFINFVRLLAPLFMCLRIDEVTTTAVSYRRSERRPERQRC